jgi:hypothetical protein
VTNCLALSRNLGCVPTIISAMAIYKYTVV